MGEQKFQLLHLSDIHIDTKTGFDRSLVLDPLLDRVKEDRGNGLNPEIIVVTGDIAYGGKKEEYDHAKRFFDDLLKATDLPKERLFLVPGNHDVDRSRYRKSDVPKYENMRDLNDELENLEYRADLFKGFANYFEFVKSNYPHLKSNHGDLVPFVHNYKAKTGLNIGLLGLNSAWMCRKSPDEGEITIGEYQVKKAIEELAIMGSVDLTISMFHHPLHWLMNYDAKKLKKNLDGNIILSGHLHDSEGGLYKDLDGIRYCFQAGSAYLDSQSKWPMRYHYITIDWCSDAIKLNFRMYDKDSGSWVLDGAKGTDGERIFKPAGISKSVVQKVEQEKKSQELPELPDSYVRWVIDRCKYMDIDRLREGSRIVSVSLPEVYIPLMARSPHDEKRKKAKKDLSVQNVEMSIKDIESLASENEYLLIRGEAGSGKTTLIKHMAYSLIKKQNKWGLNDCLPVLIFLKELKDFAGNNKGMSPNKASAEKILSFYIDNVAQNGLSLDIIKAYAEAGRILLLVDGLDEVDPAFRDFVVSSLADYRISYKSLKMLITGRPHGITGSVAERFGDKSVDVEELTDSQVETFILKWFSFVNGEETGTGNKTAEMMIGEMKTHPDIDRLRRNPLMLTAICVLYHDEKTLPDQRAELYKKFITNLLVRRFGDEHGRVHKFLKKLAHDMFLDNEKGVDKATAKKILSAYHSTESKEELDARFDRIENDSGLMKLEAGKYRFCHLTFQEFLTAIHMIDTEEEHYANPVKPFWNDERFKEVIELYIGFLSIDNAGMANRIVKDVLSEEDSDDYGRWRLASRALLDIHERSRQPEAVQAAVERMLHIIDNSAEPLVLSDAGEIIGYLGDTRDLKEFVKIEGGEYDLQGLGQTKLKEFAICKYPVTNSWFAEFVKDNGYEKKEFWNKEGWKWLGKNSVKQSKYWDNRTWRCPNSPVVGVSWYEADAFTKWLTKALDGDHIYRLPTEEEWQAAAAGKEGREFSWGSGWDEMKCNNSKTVINKTSSAGIFKAGDTPEGVSDLTGNIWEWTSSLYDKSKGTYVLRGGSWAVGDKNDFYCRVREWDNPSFRYFFFGFRCART